jgi:hypothetical protein
MKSILFFTLVLVMMLPLAAFGQIQNSIVVTTDKASYSEGETIVITGEVMNLYSGTPVSVIVKAPNGNLVSIINLEVSADKKFSTEVTAGGALMKSIGVYTVTAQYGTENRSATATFEFGGSTVTPPTPVDHTGITDTTVSVQGSSDLVGYEITGGKLLSVMPDVDANSLIISVDASEDGSLTLTIPRSVLDATINDGDDEFFVLVDGEGVNFDETSSSTSRTLAIPFQAGAEEIEIIGSHVVPEHIPEPTKKIPNWVKNIFVWYANDQVSEIELLNAIEYLINEGTIKIGN